MTNPSTILIVSGDHRIYRYLDSILRSDGNITIGASSSEEAFRLVGLRRPDLIVVGNELSSLPGIEVAKVLRAGHDTGHLPIILITESNNAQARMDGFIAGLEVVFTMPLDAQELLLKARNLLLSKARADDSLQQILVLKKQLQESAESMGQIRAAIDTPGDAIIWVSRSAMTVVEANTTACLMLGYTREELFGLCPTAIFGSSLRQIKRDFDCAIAGTERRQIRQAEFTRKDDSRVAVEVHRYAQNLHGNWSIATVARDVSKRREIEERLYQLAYYDTLTGLPNRILFYNTLERTLIRSAGKGLLVALLFIDLDYFKAVNDKLGHAMGDKLLGEVGARLRASLKSGDAVGRLGGDEFAMVLLSTDGNRAMIAAIELQAVLGMPFLIGGHELFITVSIGVTFHREGRYDADTLIKFADAAMYRAKQAGRNRIRLFTSQMSDEMQADEDLEHALRRAVSSKEFVIHYQPQFNSATKHLSGFEALLRWNRPGSGLLLPDSFIGILESSGLILQVGQWVLETVCQDIRTWIESGVKPIRVAVNVSGRQWNETNVEESVLKALEASFIPAELLELELTESAFMANTDHTTSSIRNLRKLGVRMSIDDFGTGYSSLSYLRAFAVDRLKIDNSFIRRIGMHRDDDALVRAIIKIAHSLNLEVVAEGVETERQQAFLGRHRCDHLQGYLFSLPLAMGNARALLLLTQALRPMQAAVEVPSTERHADEEGVAEGRKLLPSPHTGESARSESLYLVRAQ
jgi:diguanylate cyclase (GGDEF)-like protein/PAS domain S-box-containing protein